MNRKFALAGAVFMAAVGLTSPVLAGAKDYAFEPVAAEVKNGKDVMMAVRLIHKPTGKPVDGAVFFRTRLDMTLDKMPDLTAQLTALPSTEPGIYKFRADLTMVGPWTLKLMAKVPGESETVEGTVVFRSK